MLCELESERVNPFTPKSVQFQISPCSLTSNITSHSMENLALHTLLRWKMIQLPNSHYLTYTLNLFKYWENALFELESERVNPTHVAVARRAPQTCRTGTSTRSTTPSRRRRSTQRCWTPTPRAAECAPSTRCEQFNQRLQVYLTSRTVTPLIRR